MDRLEAMSMLIKVLEAGNFSKASKELNVPLPTLSRKISELEAQLDVRLIHRTTRKLSFTESGLEYIKACKRILEQVEEAESDLKGEYSEPKGDLVITAPVMFGRLYVLPIVTEFLSLYANINVQLVLADGNVNLFEDEVDMAIRIGKLPDSSLIATPVGKMRIVTCVNPSLLEEYPPLASPEDLAGFPCVTLKTNMTIPHWSFRLAKSTSPVSMNIASRLTVTDSESAVYAAINKVGATQQLHYQVMQGVQAGTLKIVLPEFEPESVPVHLLHKTRKYMPQKMKSFLNFAAPKLKDRVQALCS
ncbi:LysR family transcriptional regulator [Aliiglaciecola sp. 3_MG-2023]|uniref:LysR family transcriptional regulator n=1 Tax=unclassified Aliiglaciecola TaxID=2593648 RepID=UPI0026E257B6|nr:MULTISPECIES: LysR family transcriptional regulator [unclassified Aliiglaciecola]MDO6694648.1 LysR family transcriptional regulator [Aliiglaciecola sp. 3_MG-2023]MDO6711693.1 LysR family transcriptional regulator [Aliiglaciecola sp. 2_MG-2023]MDO6752764.1 LysR family transcriptional regulator [Aliiglaciecola sp. 1_MG-2023]